MSGQDIIDDTTGDYDRLETELVAQDRDASRVATADIDEGTARRLVGELVEDDVVTPVPDHRILSTSPVALMQQTLPGCAFCDSPPGWARRIRGGETNG
jgi:hypothetical protein